MAAKIAVTRQEYQEAIRQLRDSAAQLGNRFNLNQLTWQPAAGERWSIAECLDHLTISTAIYLDAMQSAIGGAPTGPMAGIFQTAGFASTKFTRDLDAPPRTKIPAPGKFRPRATLKPETILPDFLAAMDRVSSLVASTARNDLNAVRFPNPLTPLIRFTVGTGFLIVAAHGRRHLWQAEQVTLEPDFPGA